MNHTFLYHEPDTPCGSNVLEGIALDYQQIGQFARSTGRLAKTDKLDAQDIAQFGKALQPPLTELKPEKLRQISGLITVRRQCLDMSTMMKNGTHWNEKLAKTLDEEA